MESNRNPTVSVIMNGLNCSKYLREAIDSVFAQTYKDWEIIYWDDASTDNSLEIAESYGEKVRCFKSEETFPLGKVRNLAMEQAKGDFIAFLDCDDIWLPEKLEKQIPLFENNSSVGLVHSDAWNFTLSGKVYKSHKKKPPEGNVFRELLRGYFICMPTAIIRRNTLQDLLTWFDDRFTQIEEVDLFLRIAYKWKVVYVDEPLAKYRLHPSSWSFSHRDCSPKENEILINKFSNLYHDFEKNYGNEISIIKNQIAYERFYLYWKDGQTKKAQETLKPFLKFNKKLIAYIFSFLVPFEVFYSLVGFVKNKISKNMVHFN